jgi:UDP-2,4-diacetamido-2,4,6-trideoxy-beta-L-altropyranose hydrolase
MRIAFRTDASTTIGHGHVRRCLTLAAALREHGHAVRFICREHDGNLCDVVSRQGFPVDRLPVRSTATAGSADGYASWLGARWLDDAHETLDAVGAGGRRPDWLVVDHYGIDARWERAVRSDVKRVMAIDDLANREHECELLLDQNLVAGLERRYQGRVPARCVQLLGPQYCLLEATYGSLHKRIAPRTGPIRRILVSYGGADTRELTALTLAAIVRLGSRAIAVDAVVSGPAGRAARVREQFAAYGNIRVHDAGDSLAPLMAQADLGIGASGTTTWERLCLGLPAIVVTVADNQRPIAEELARLGLIHWLGHYSEVDEQEMFDLLSRLVAAGADEDASRRALALVDGCGAERVRAALTVDESADLRLRRMTAADEALVLEWANDPGTRANSFSAEQITAAAHHEWLVDRLSHPERCRPFVVETPAHVPIGQVRFDRIEGGWRVNYSVAAHLRGRGLGRRIMQLALRQLSEEEPGAMVLAQVKLDNVASHRVFESLGFQPQRSAAAVDYRLWL